jgi:quercetin dioxygenase-like cupin family protein
MGRIFVRFLMTSLLMVYSSASVAETIDTHKTFFPQRIKWGPAPSGLPAGAEAALLYGDPQKASMYAIWIKMPTGYEIPPHVHRQPELVTVISGRFSLGLGQTADPANLETLSSGSFSSMPQGIVHYVYVNEDAIVQISAIGPWQIDYVNPKDDPRLNGIPETTNLPLYSSKGR